MGQIKHGFILVLFSFMCLLFRLTLPFSVAAGGDIGRRREGGGGVIDAYYI